MQVTVQLQKQCNRNRDGSDQPVESSNGTSLLTWGIRKLEMVKRGVQGWAQKWYGYFVKDWVTIQKSECFDGIHTILENVAVPRLCWQIC